MERMGFMNPIFWLLLFIAAITAWFTASGLFTSVGRLLMKKWDKLVEDPENLRENEKIKTLEEKNNE